MRAIISTKYGGPEVLQLTEVEKPSPKDNEVLIKIHATSVTSGDARIRRADPFLIRLIFGFNKPRKSILGVVIAGEIEAIGKNVTKFKVGNQVYGTTGMDFGAYAEYTCKSEGGVLALIPKDITYEGAAAIPFGATASLHFLKKAKIKKNQKVLIYGASGALGTAGIQLAKVFGAEITAVCSTSNIELVKNLGADNVIDYTQEGLINSFIKYDVIYDTVDKSTYSESLKAINNNGYLLLASAGISDMLKGLWTSVTSSKKVISGVIKETADDLNYFNELILDGKLKAVIDRTYPLEQMAAAHAYVDKGHKKGNVIATM